jgi:hypothetical protein
VGGVVDMFVLVVVGGGCAAFWFIVSVGVVVCVLVLVVVGGSCVAVFVRLAGVAS